MSKLSQRKIKLSMQSSLIDTWSDGFGVERRLGNFPAPYGYHLPHMGAVPLVDPATWQEFDLTDCPVAIKDQGQFGACNGHAAATSLELARWIAGESHVDLSAWAIYATLCGGWDRGSSISEALTLLKQRGTCPDSFLPHGTINPSRITQAAAAEFPRFKIEIGYSLTGFDEMMAATQLRQPFNFSISVNTGFNQLDADGCPQNQPGDNNHAVTGGLGAKRGKNGEWMILCQNSWSTQWGLNGRFYIKRRNVGGRYFDAYTVVAISADPKNYQPPAR